MASTYTTELRIEKIATGEQSGTWGTTTNTQYDLWEASISGTTTVAFASDGNDTLTTASGSDDEARHMFIDLTGGSTLTATRDMVVPLVSKLYFVSNQTTGGQSVQIIGSSGTGITVPTGKYMALYCDGTNILDATDYITAMTIGTLTTAAATITGGTITGITDLVVADGGTGASTFTDGGLLLGSGTGPITAMSVLADGEMVVGDGTTDPVAESGATLRTSVGVGTGDSPQFTGVELGHATDSTITRVSAGLLAVEGDNLLMDSNVATIESIEQQSKSAAYTLVLGDAGKHVFHPAADTTARIWTIPANASVAYPIGTAVTFVNETLGGIITISITTDTMTFTDGTTGSRTLAASGICTALKVTSTKWVISGVGLT